MLLRDHGRVITRGPGGGLSAALFLFCGAEIVADRQTRGPLPGPRRSENRASR